MKVATSEEVSFEAGCEEDALRPAGRVTKATPGRCSTRSMQKDSAGTRGRACGYAGAGTVRLMKSGLVVLLSGGFG